MDIVETDCYSLDDFVQAIFSVVAVSLTLTLFVLLLI